MFRRRYPNKRRYGHRSAVKVPLPRLVSRPANKAVDVLTVTGSLHSTAQITLLNGIVQGAAFNQRLGQAIVMKGIELKLCFHSVRTNTALTEMIRCYLVYDRQSNGAAPTNADVMLALAQDNSTSSDVQSGQNMDKRQRYLVLWDYLAKVPTQTITTVVTTNPGIGESNLPTIIQSIPLPDLKVNYSLSTGVIGAIATGSLHLVTLGNLAQNSESMQVTWSARLTIHDSPE